MIYIYIYKRRYSVIVDANVSKASKRLGRKYTGPYVAVSIPPYNYQKGKVLMSIEDVMCRRREQWSSH